MPGSVTLSGYPGLEAGNEHIIFTTSIITLILKNTYSINPLVGLIVKNIPLTLLTVFGDVLVVPG